MNKQAMKEEYDMILHVYIIFFYSLATIFQIKLRYAILKSYFRGGKIDYLLIRNI